MMFSQTPALVLSRISFIEDAIVESDLEIAAPKLGTPWFHN